MELFTAASSGVATSARELSPITTIPRSHERERKAPRKPGEGRIRTRQQPGRHWHRGHEKEPAPRAVEAVPPILLSRACFLHQILGCRRARAPADVWQRNNDKCHAGPPRHQERYAGHRQAVGQGIRLTAVQTGSRQHVMQLAWCHCLACRSATPTACTRTARQCDPVQMRQLADQITRGAAPRR